MWENQRHTLTFTIFLNVKAMIVSKTSIKNHNFSNSNFFFKFFLLNYDLSALSLCGMCLGQMFV